VVMYTYTSDASDVDGERSDVQPKSETLLHSRRRNPSVLFPLLYYKGQPDSYPDALRNDCCSAPSIQITIPVPEGS
jgi:hypothetical protein